MRISDWSSDVCSSDRLRKVHGPRRCAARMTRPNNATTGLYPVFGELHHVITFKTFARAAAIVLAPLLIAACGVNTLPPQERSEERRVGKECFSTCRSRWSPYPLKKKRITKKTN